MSRVLVSLISASKLYYLHWPGSLVLWHHKIFISNGRQPRPRANIPFQQPITITHQLLYFNNSNIVKLFGNLYNIIKYIILYEFEICVVWSVEFKYTLLFIFIIL